MCLSTIWEAVPAWHNCVVQDTYLRTDPSSAFVSKPFGDGLIIVLNNIARRRPSITDGETLAQSLLKNITRAIELHATENQIWRDEMMRIVASSIQQHHTATASGFRDMAAKIKYGAERFLMPMQEETFAGSAVVRGKCPCGMTFQQVRCGTVIVQPSPMMVASSPIIPDTMAIPDDVVPRESEVETAVGCGSNIARQQDLTKMTTRVVHCDTRILYRKSDETV